MRKLKEAIVFVLMFVLSRWLIPAIPRSVPEMNPLPEIKIVVDPRVELMSIIFRLAGNNEYNQRAVVPYVENIRKHFDRFRNHPAVTMGQKLELGFHGPMLLAIYLTPPPELKERVPLDTPGLIDDRFDSWMGTYGPKVRFFLEEVRRFVKDTDFMAFFDNNQALYDVMLDRAEEFVQSQVHPEWFKKYFGTPQGGKFILVLAPNNGGPSYGPMYRDPDGNVEYYCILGLPLLDENQLPVFGDKELRDLEIIIHEFCHSFVNPLVDRHQLEMKGLGEKIFPMVESDMRSQAYGDWPTMMRETFVRACVLRYIHSYKGDEAAIKRLEIQLARRFILAEKVYDLLGEYENQRERYTSLESFFPDLITGLSDFANKPEEFEKIGERLKAIRTRGREAVRRRLDELRAHPDKLPKVITT